MQRPTSQGAGLARGSMRPPISVDPGAHPPSPDAPPQDPDQLPRSLTDPLSGVERLMSEYVRSLGLPRNLLAATEYALLGGGKRLRPLLVVHTAAAVGGPAESALAPAAAVEMVHAFSLVHDDLPAIDNDDLRRGKPTVHVAHGEAMAILVGDGLMSAAFQLLLQRTSDPAIGGWLCRELAEGTTAMIAGQVLDTLGGFEEGLTPLRELEQIHHHKTGALLRASCRMGAIAGLGASARPDHPLLAAATSYGRAIGLMFQVVDDLLDVEQSADHTGKRTSKDQEAGKRTYPAILGVERSRHIIEQLHDDAMAAIEPMGPAASGLGELCRYLSVRTK